MAATISDVARSAGVSIATVSRVINNRGAVNQEMKRRVQRAVAELGYVPNSIARSLKQDCSKLIGITASDLSVAFFPQMVQGVEKYFLPKGYATIVSSTYDDAGNEESILHHLVSRRVDVLLVNSTGKNEDMLEQAAESGVPVILYDRRSRDHAFPSVYVDKQKSVYQAMDHLYSLGHRRIALVTGPKQLISNYDRCMGAQGFVLDRELEPSDLSIFFGAFSEQYGVQAMEEIMRMERRPTAVITGSISITAGIMRYCREHRLRIPEDLSIVSMGNFIYSNAVGMQLTYMDDRTEALAEAVIHMLEQALLGEKLSPNYQVVLDPRLCLGESSGHCK